MIISPKIQLRETGKMGKGFFAKQDIEKDQQLLKLEDQKIISCDRYDDIDEYQNLTNSNNISNKMLFAYFLAAVFFTKHHNFEYYKDIYEYFKNLPKKIHSLIGWSSQQLDKIVNGQLVHKIKQKQCEIKKQFQEIKQKIKKQWEKPYQKQIQFRIFDNRQEIQLVTFQSVVYFYAVIQSRSVHYRCKEDGDSNVGALAPILQLFNHSINPQCQVQSSQTFKVTTVRKINKDQQIFVSYGKYSEQKFLQTYGFLQKLVEPIQQDQNYRLKVAEQYNKFFMSKKDNQQMKNL